MFLRCKRRKFFDIFIMGSNRFIHAFYVVVHLKIQLHCIRIRKICNILIFAKILVELIIKGQSWLSFDYIFLQKNYAALMFELERQDVYFQRSV